MGRGTKTTEFLKECMADALIRLMREKKMSKISIEEITQAAGVGRATWFRNFSAKNEAVTYKLIRLWYGWADEHGLAIRDRYSIDNALDFFSFNREIAHILRVIYQADIQPALYDAFYQIMVARYEADPEARYQSSFYSYGLFGLLDEWIRRDFYETPEEMTRIFQNMLRT